MINEFTVVWFESTQKWVAVLDTGSVIDNSFSAVGYAVNAALARIGCPEAAFDCVENFGDYMRYMRDPEAAQ